MSEQPKTSPHHPDDEPIVPIAFTPIKAERQRWRLPNVVNLVVGAVLLVFVSLSWFVLTARSVSFVTSPAESVVSLSGRLHVKVGARYLIRQGEVELNVKAPGYYDHNATLSVGEAQTQTFTLVLDPLPGLLDVDSGNVTGAEVLADGKPSGTTPLKQLPLEAGEHTILVRKERYESQQSRVLIKGRSTSQSLSLELLPAWGTVVFATTPVGATVSIDGKEVGQTPLNAEVLAGEHEVVVKLAAHKAWTDAIKVIARQTLTLPSVTLQPADGLVLLRSTPSKAGVTVDGVYKGLTPIELTLTPGRTHQLAFFLNGYKETTREIRTSAAEENAVNVTLDPLLSSVQVKATPEDAELFVNGVSKGKANQSVELLAASQTIEVRREGYAPFTTTFISRPGMEQQLTVVLKTLAQQKQEAIKPQITTVNGQDLKLLYPGNFVMGSSRREAGRQANEVQRNVSLTRPFYLSLTEVTNKQFAGFDPKHMSGMVQGHTLATDNQPVARVTWEQAARYTNWLSEKENLKPFYKVEGEAVTGSNDDSNGYRLPTEAEWEWAARVNGDPASLMKFPWGDTLPPPPNHGNYADISAGGFLGRVLADYNDGFMVSAPVASFPPNANGFFDIGGNVAEWVHDYYGINSTTGTNIEKNPLGPGTGAYHVIRGSSWAHGSVTELRLSYRDYNNAARDDVGFRIARYLGD
jgi:formylglycine-generating enzyme required for sulfatase activity